MLLDIDTPVTAASCQLDGSGPVTRTVAIHPYSTNPTRLASERLAALPSRAIGHRASGRARGPAEQQPEIAAGNVGKGVSESILSGRCSSCANSLKSSSSLVSSEISGVDIATLYSTRVVKGQALSGFSLPIFVALQR